MKKNLTYCFILLAIVSCTTKKTLPSLRETYSKDNKAPFGTYVALDFLRQLYPNDIHVEKNDFTTNWNEIYNSSVDTGTLYISISRNLALSDEDVGAMLGYVSYGNTLFISSQYITQNLLDTLGISLTNNEMVYNDWKYLKNTFLQMDPSLGIDSSRYGYYFLPFQNFFVKYNERSTAVLGLNENGQPDFLVVLYGKGRLYLHCEPRSLSNYFLLYKDNYHYFQNVLAFMPSTLQTIFWDDYYNKHNYVHSSKSVLGFLLQYTSMSWAFWLLLALLILYIIFSGKRKQRIVPVIPAVKNTTVAFTETISRLYLQQKDNKNMADKMITYFFEYIRNQFFINTNLIDEEFITTLSRKSAVSKTTTEQLFKTIAGIQQKKSVSDQQLLLLNQQIENFHKTKK